MLADDARLGPLYNDYLFQQKLCYSSEEWEEMTGREVRSLLRIETLAEQIWPKESWDEFRQEFGRTLAASQAENGVGFKSIAAYRTGLEIQQIDAAEASRHSTSIAAKWNRPMANASGWPTRR